MSYEYNHSPFPLTVAGTIVLTIVYSIWLIEFIPFTLFDDAVMWIYGWYLNWLEAGDPAFFITFAAESVFIYLKYILLPHLVAAWSMSRV